MLTTSELIRLFSKSKSNDYVPNTEDISNIMSYVQIDSGILENGVDYYFKINLLELSKSGIPDDTVFEMTKNGWTLSKDRKFIYFFY